MQSNQGEYQSLQILDEIIEDPQALWVLGFGDIDEGANLGGLRNGAFVSHLYSKERKEIYLERYVLTAQPDLQLLSSILILLRPLAIIFPIQL